MAGLFGMFDPTKEGVGVSKNAPQKKRFFLFFEIYARKFTKIFILNMVYALICIPIVTIGPATAALTFCMRNFAREEHADLGDFFEQFKKNFKQGFVIGFLQFLSFAVVIFGIIFYGALMKQGNFFGFIGFFVSVSVIFLLIFMSYYVYMMMVTFHMTIRQLIKNSFLFAFIGLGRNIITTIILAVVFGWFTIYGILQIVLPIFDAEFIPSLSSASLAFTSYLMLIPSFCCFVSCFNVYPCVKEVLIDPALKELESKRKKEEAIFDDEI